MSTAGFSSRLDAAIAYARLGLAVVALDENTNAPIDGGDRQDVEAAFEAWSQRPLSNVGLQLGTGWVAVRARDTETALRGADDLRERGYLPGRAVLYGPDGFVWLLRFAEADAVDDRELCPGVHLLSREVVVLPPSAVTEGRWRWLHGMDAETLLTSAAVAMPDALARLARDAAAPFTAAPAPTLLWGEDGPQEAPPEDDGPRPPVLEWDGDFVGGIPAIEESVDVQQNVDDAIKVLAAMEDLYQNGHNLVTVRADDGLLAGITREHEPPRLVRLGADQIFGRISQAAYWYQTKKNKQGMPYRERVRPPARVDKVIETMPRLSAMRQLERVVEMPCFRPDGSVIERAGYDTATGTLFIPRGTFPPVPTKPTKDSAVRSVTKLTEPFLDFPWKTLAHRSAMVASILSIVGRMLYQGNTPMFLVDGNVQGVGKGMASNVVSEITSGRLPVAFGNHVKDEEMRKNITTHVRNLPAMLVIDNVEGKFGCPALASALTLPKWSDRLLSTNVDINIPLSLVWFANGNNIQLTKDMTRRVVHCRMETALTDPASRQDFRHKDLLGWCRKHRHALLVEALTVLRAFIVAGQPDQGLQSWGSFDGWSKVIRNAMVWAGQPDTFETRAGTEEMNPEDALFAGFLVGLRDMLTRKNIDRITIAAMLEELRKDAAAKRVRNDYVEEYAEMRGVVSEVFGGEGEKLPDALRVSGWLRKHKNKVVPAGRERLAITSPVETTRLGTTTWQVVTHGV